jgi:hypothetical protein
MHCDWLVTGASRESLFKEELPQKTKDLPYHTIGYRHFLGPWLTISARFPGLAFDLSISPFATFCLKDLSVLGVLL